jgi:hypothetical protein
MRGKQGCKLVHDLMIMSVLPWVGTEGVVALAVDVVEVAVAVVDGAEDVVEEGILEAIDGAGRAGWLSRANVD